MNEIKCPECGRLRPKTRQHRLPKRFNTILSPRNKKIECKECQDFFDTETAESAEEMASNDNVKAGESLQYNGKTYYVENECFKIPPGGQKVIDTGSQIQGFSAEMVGVTYTKSGYPLSMKFDEDAPKDQDRVVITNNHSEEGKVFVSIIVDKPKKKTEDVS